MYAVLRMNSFDPGKLRDTPEAMDEFDRIHAAQPGFLGTATVDLGGARRFFVNLWDGRDHAQQAIPVLGPVIDRLVNPLLSGPSVLVGTGPVLAWPCPHAEAR